MILDTATEHLFGSFSGKNTIDQSQNTYRKKNLNEECWEGLRQKLVLFLMFFTE